MTKLQRFFLRIIKVILNRRIGKGVTGDNKIEFEKDVLKLLAKYDCFQRNTENILQRAEIIVDVDKYPIVNLKLIALKHENDSKAK